MSCVNPTTNGPSGRLLQDMYDPILRLAGVQPPRNPNKPLTSFLIADILNGRGSEPPLRRNYPPPHHPERVKTPQSAIRRPWDDSCCRSEGYSTDVDDDEEVDDDEDDDDAEINVDDERNAMTTLTTKSVCPLDALLKMTSKTFDANDRNSEGNDAGKPDSSFGYPSKSQPTKKRRKSRTAFTNKQIYELEKRFLYQKYLTPVDRDEIAQGLGLSNAQVITWFQNRRAKLKRDMEELKADVTAAKNLPPDASISVIGGIDEMLKPAKACLLRKKEARNPLGVRTESNDSNPGHRGEGTQGSPTSPVDVSRSADDVIMTSSTGESLIGAATTKVDVRSQDGDSVAQDKCGDCAKGAI